MARVKRTRPGLLHIMQYCVLSCYSLGLGRFRFKWVKGFSPIALVPQRGVPEMGHGLRTTIACMGKYQMAFRAIVAAAAKNKATAVF